MNRSIIFISLLLLTSFFVKAQNEPRTEEYTILELSTRCNKSNLSITNNAGGTTLSEVYDRKTNTLTDDERLLIAMNDLNAKGFKLKSTTVVAEKCWSKRAFLFFKSRPNKESVADRP